MRISALFTAVLVAGLPLVQGAMEYKSEPTTTKTSTMTQTVTITRCNPTATDCPLHHTSTSKKTTFYPASNTTSCGPTAHFTNATTSPTSVTKTSVTLVESSSAPSATQVTASGAAGLLVHSGLLVAVLGAGAALLL